MGGAKANHRQLGYHPTGVIMGYLHTIAIFTVAFLHVVFFVLESVLWTTPKVRHVFGTTQEDAEATRVLALNQGFYNLGAAMLLIWFYAIGSESGVLGVLVFLAVMGIIGALTANWRIIIVQSVPAFAAVMIHALN